MKSFNKIYLNLYKEIINIFQSPFLKNLTVIGTGNFFGQLILISSTPILSRLYNPESFGYFGLFTAFGAIIIPSISLRYNIANIVAKDKEKKALFILSILIALIMSTLIFLCFIFFGKNLKEITNTESLGFTFYLLPIYVFFYGTIIATRNFFNSLDKYKIIRNIILIQSILTFIFSITIGFIFKNYYGLILSINLSLLATLVVLFFKFKEITIRNLNNIFNFKKLFNVLKKYKKFPIYTALPSILDSLSLVIPLIFINLYQSTYIVGSFVLGNKVLGAPLDLISKSLSQIHLKKVSDYINDGLDPTEYIFKLTFLLTLICLFPCLFLIFKGKVFITFVFGKEWEMAGSIISILSPAICLRFISSTISGAISASSMQIYEGVWKTTAFLTTFGIFYYFSPKINFDNLIIIFLFSEIFLYFLYYFLTILSVKKALSKSY